MDDNTSMGVGMGETAGQTDGADERTFTQDDVNDIIGKRLAKERTRIESDFAKKERELKEREYMLFAKETLEKRGYSFDLAEKLNASDAESLLKCLEALDKEIQRKIEAHMSPILRSTTAPIRGGRVGAAEDIRGAMGLK